VVSSTVRSPRFRHKNPTSVPPPTTPASTHCLSHATPQAQGPSLLELSGFAFRLQARRSPWPNRVRHPADCWLTSRCSPPCLAATQLRSISRAGERLPGGDSNPFVSVPSRAHKRPSSCSAGTHAPTPRTTTRPRRSRALRPGRPGGRPLRGGPGAGAGPSSKRPSSCSAGTARAAPSTGHVAGDRARARAPADREVGRFEEARPPRAIHPPSKRPSSCSAGTPRCGASRDHAAGAIATCRAPADREVGRFEEATRACPARSPLLFEAAELLLGRGRHEPTTSHEPRDPADRHAIAIRSTGRSAASRKGRPDRQRPTGVRPRRSRNRYSFPASSSPGSAVILSGRAKAVAAKRSGMPMAKGEISTVSTGWPSATSPTDMKP
jgi:hypothetical protein